MLKRYITPLFSAILAMILQGCAGHGTGHLADLNQLRQAPPGQVAQVLGHSSLGDGGEGLFFWDQQSREPDNDGTVIASSHLSAGRWKRSFQERLLPRWFGAAGDGQHDDTQALQKVLDAAVARGGGAVFLPPGNFRISAPLRIGSNTMLEGSGGASVLQWGGESWKNRASNSRYGVMLQIVGHANIRIANMAFDAGGANLQVICMENGVDTTPLIIENNRFTHLSRASAAEPEARSLAIALAGGRTFTRHNYCDGAASDTFNYNSGWHLVSDNIILNGEDGGIAFNNGAQGIISGNYIYNCDLGIGMGHPGKLQQSLDNSTTISGNTVSQCMIGINMGWFGYPGQAAPRNWTISGNVFKNSATTDINFDGPSAGFSAIGTITGNTSYGVGASLHSNFRHKQSGGATSSIFARLANCDHVTITGNTLVDPQARGDLILLLSSRNIVVANNVLSVSRSGGGLAFMRLHAVTGLMVSQNRVSGALDYFIRGESADPILEAHINDNLVESLAISGIAISGLLNRGEILNNRFMAGKSAAKIIDAPRMGDDFILRSDGIPVNHEATKSGK